MKKPVLSEKDKTGAAFTCTTRSCA